MIAGHDIAVDPAVVCRCEEVLLGVLRRSPDRDGLMVLVQIEYTNQGEDACRQGCEGDLDCG